jgi:hypothetical protein
VGEALDVAGKALKQTGLPGADQVANAIDNPETKKVAETAFTAAVAVATA